ncbi:hypothetical protein KPL71_012571 [Citrus sinensis]|uniref:Uncharacterized protein n=1 Tax=Citrus sinensis TaxID=2711 RepID=A0ACB8LC93_CITSI|nr:hypothetical protein KPL71_012571 [Citrus sinensis]
MEGDTGTDTLYLQLHKLSAINSEQALDNILTTLWSTRKTGLRSAEKSHVQSLLNLPSPGQVDPVVASLRSLIRKCVRENFTSDDLLKLFPPDLSLDLQSNLILLLQKHQKQWKEESSREQGSLPCLKSMTWTMEKSNSEPGNRVAVISLKVCSQKIVFFKFINGLSRMMNSQKIFLCFY